MNHVVLPPALKSLLPDTLHALCSGALYKKHERLFLAGTKPESMFYVVSGEVTLERTGLQGEAVILQRTKTGFVSEASLQTKLYHCDSQAIIDTNVIKLPIKEVSAALDKDPGFAGRWISMLNQEVKRLRLHSERLSMKSVRDRVLHLINTEGEAGYYPVRTGLKTLARELGVTHEALYRTLANLEKTGEIERSEGNLRLTPKVAGA